MKDSNTYYPIIISYYQKAYKEISSLVGIENDKKRILDKLIREQEELAKTMQLTGRCNSQRIDLLDIYEEIVFACKADNPLSVFRTMISFPVINGKWINQQRAQTNKNQQFLYESFNTYIWHNSKGATINIKNGDNAVEDSERRIAQLLMIEYLKLYMMIIHSFDVCDIDTNYVYEHLKMLNSKFIPQDRIHLFAQGLCSDFMETSH